MDVRTTAHRAGVAEVRSDRIDDRKEDPLPCGHTSDLEGALLHQALQRRSGIDLEVCTMQSLQPACEAS